MRNRILKKSFFSSPSLSRISIEAAYMFAGLWTLADDYGVLKASPRKILGNVYDERPNIQEEQVLEWLIELEKVDAIRVYERKEGERFLVIPSWEEHQGSFKRSKDRHLDPKEQADFLKKTTDALQTHYRRTTDALPNKNQNKKEEALHSKKTINREERGAVERRPLKDPGSSLNPKSRNKQKGPESTASLIPEILRQAEACGEEDFYDERDPDLLEKVPVEWRAVYELTEARLGRLTSWFEWRELEKLRYQEGADPSWPLWALRETFDRSPKIDRPVEYALAVLRRVRGEGFDLTKNREESNLTSSRSVPERGGAPLGA